MGYPVGHMEDQTEMDNGYWYIVVHHVRTTARHVIHPDLQILTYHILSQKSGPLRHKCFQNTGTSSFYPVTENGQMFPCVQSDHPSFWMQGYNKPLPAWCCHVRFPNLHNSVVQSFPSPPHMYHFVHLLFRPFFPIMEKHVVVPCFC